MRAIGSVSSQDSWRPPRSGPASSWCAIYRSSAVRDRGRGRWAPAAVVALRPGLRQGPAARVGSAVARKRLIAPRENSGAALATHRSSRALPSSVCVAHPMLGAALARFARWRCRRLRRRRRWLSRRPTAASGARPINSKTAGRRQQCGRARAADGVHTGARPPGSSWPNWTMAAAALAASTRSRWRWARGGKRRDQGAAPLRIDVSSVSWDAVGESTHHGRAAQSAPRTQPDARPAWASHVPVGVRPRRPSAALVGAPVASRSPIEIATGPAPPRRAPLRPRTPLEQPCVHEENSIHGALSGLCVCRVV